MKLTASFAALATVLLSAVTLAAPNPASLNQNTIPLNKKRDALLVPGTNEVDFTKVRAHLDHVKAKYSDNLQAFKSNTGNTHPLQSKTFEPFSKRAGTGSVSLTDIQNEELWSGPVKFGGQTIYVDFDTGSADVIVNHNSYTPGPTAKNTGRTFRTAYGDGTTASGPVYTDTFSIGGLSASSAALGWSSNQFLTGESPNNGIAGMSYPSLATLGYPPFFDTLSKAGALAKNVFTFTLSKGTSTLYLGGVDPKAGTPTYVNVDSSQGFWTIDSGSIAGVSTGSIQDTGTTVIVAPTNTAQSIFANLPGVTQFQQDGAYYGAYNCNSPPKVTIKLGGYSQALSSATTSFGTTNDGQCVLSVVGEDIGLDSVILGDSWLQNVHAVFDRDSNRVGFSRQ
ncbi:acid protease [Meira miltonrushii]|uniref:Acid protease n=1 Tax=Meira miltonrushii TaxID=1280837 RepID=A0A316VSY7_9BASI|nr:acid protease [Meira miltonrushii]PWN38625.1 acid protease [Meira miltonrushii]